MATEKSMCTAQAYNRISCGHYNVTDLFLTAGYILQDMFRVNILITKPDSLEVTPHLWIFWNIPFSMFQTSHVPLQPFCADLTSMTPTCYDFNSLSKWQPIQTENKTSLSETKALQGPEDHFLSPACTVAPQTQSVFTEPLTSLYTSCWDASVRKIMEQFSITWFSTVAYNYAIIHMSCCCEKRAR